MYYYCYWSIGIAALELATGEAPFAGLPLTEVINKSGYIFDY